MSEQACPMCHEPHGPDEETDKCDTLTLWAEIKRLRRDLNIARGLFARVNTPVDDKDLHALAQKSKRGGMSKSEALGLLVEVQRLRKQLRNGGAP